jgi:tripartite-type tricarboxylate transporter receptor subunit TctC
MKKFFEIVILFACFVLLFSGSGWPQAFPSKPITAIITSAPGQIGDVTTRVLLDKASKFLGQPFNFVNNNTAGGAVAISMLKKAEPDGYTIITIASGNLIWAPFMRPLDYSLDDFTPVMQNMVIESGVVVKADAPWKTFKELVTYAKQNPGKVSYAITSAGVPMDLAMQYVAKQEGIRWTAVPNPGTDPNTMLLGGHVSAYSGATSWLPHVKSGAFRLLAVHNAARMKEFPDVPTFKELGYDFTHETQAVILAPKGTPESVISKLDEALRKGLEDKEVVSLYTKLAAKIEYRNHRELSKYLIESRDATGKVIRTLGLTPEPAKK